MRLAIEQRDIERIVRDVLTTYGLDVSTLRVERTAGGWRVTLGAGDRVLNTDVPNGSPALIRSVMTQWAEAHV